MSDLIHGTITARVVGLRDAAIAKAREAAETIERGHALAREASRLLSSAVTDADGNVHAIGWRAQSEPYQSLFTRFNAEQAATAFREHADASIWHSLMRMSGIEDLMDKKLKDEFRRSLESDAVPEVSEDNIQATFAKLVEDRDLIFARGLARAFINLDRRFKSHDGFKIGSRIIITRVFNEYGHENYHSNAFDTIADVERVFAVLDGNRPDARALKARVMEDRGRGYDPRQSVTESTYFRIKGFMNGNVHLWFTRDDLVEKANRVLADYYGAVLPDAVPDLDPNRPDLHSATGALAKDLSFYPTPKDLAEYLVMQCNQHDARVLEPSAGEGALVAALLRRVEVAHVTAVEVDVARASKIPGDARVRVMPGVNFLHMTPDPSYDVVIMNPPFYGTHWVEHVVHAWEFVKPRGQLIAVLPATAEFGNSAKHLEFRDWLTKRTSQTNPFYDLPAESFASSGTRVQTCYINLYKR